MLDIQHISKTFNVGTVNEKRAVTDLSLHLDKGDFVTVIGSNGAGKSTLFNAIAGSFYVDEGRILLNGKDITFTREHDRSRVIGRLFQDPLRGTAPHMSIEENLALAYLRAAHGNPFSRITAKDRELFRAQLAQLDMGLEDRLGQPVGLLSGGQRQALTLLMATMVPPELLLLDEHGGARPGHGGKSARAHAARGGGASHHLPDGDAQHDAGSRARQPHADDGGRRHRARRRGYGTRRHDGGGSR